MDCNSIIYDAFRLLENEGHDDTTFYNKLIDAIIVIIESYINLIMPSHIIYIAFDGVAPFAKMEQQRNRRNKTNYISKIVFDNTKPKPRNFTTSMITPGTDFMKLLSVRISRHFESNLDGRKYIVSTSEEAGEGEHKLFRHMRENKSSDSTVALYGLDSDLIMLSIFHCTYFKNIYIFREAPEFMKSAIPIKPTTKDEPYFMNIGKLSTGILNEMKCITNNPDRIYDYIFMCFFLGNDFLPHFPCLNIRTNGIDILMNTYSQHIGKWSDRGLVLNGTIQWKWVSKFVYELAKQEYELLIQQYDMREKSEKRQYSESTPEERESTFQNIPLIYRPTERYICPSEKFWENRYYNGLFRQSSSEEFIKEICANYLTGLEWVFKYYTTGCPDWRWAYQAYYPPLLKDLVRFIPSNNHTFIHENNNMPFKPNTQLAYVLPKDAFGLLSRTNRDYLLKNELKYYVDIPDFEWAFCRYFWEAHAVLPHVPMDTLETWDKLLLDT